MIGRLVAVLALLVSGLVLGSAAPAAACSCELLGAGHYVQRADYAFSGTTTKVRGSDDEAIYRFSVDTVYRGDVRRTQDVVTPVAPGDAVSSCESRLPVGGSWLMLGSVDDEGRLTFGRCQDPPWSLDDPFTDTLVTALGTGSEPIAGKDLVEIDRVRRDDLRWVGLGAGVIGLTVLGWVVLRRRRPRHSG